MYIYWKPLLLLGLIFWIIINSADVLQRKLSLFPISADPSTLSNPSDKSIEIEKTVSTTSVEQVGSKEILDSSPGYAVLFANIFIFVFSLIFCSLAKFFVRIVYLGFRRTDVPNIDESQEITPTSQMSHIIEAVAVTSSESAICSEKRSLIIDTSCPNLTMKMNNQSHQTCQTMFHTPLFTKNEQVLKAECSKLREELLALHSNSIKEHALLSRKLDSMTKEKRELSKRLTVVQKENQVAKTQLDELMNDKNMLQKRLENATKDFRVNTKTKKVALAKLEEISSTVDDLKRQLEQVTRDKEILQGKLQVLRTEYEQMEERLHMMQLKETDRINEERAISLESEKAERDDSINSKIDDKIIEDQSTCQSSQSSLNRIISKENVFLPYVISQTEVNMKNIQTKILELEKSLKEFNSKPDIRCDSINEIKAEPDSEKIRKPLMEKKRRARINDSLETLKKILLDSETLLKEGTSKKNGQRTAKLEKADILEMTVRYLQYLHQKVNTIQNQHKPKPPSILRSAADSSCEEIKLGLTLIPTKLKTGELVFIMPTPDHRQLKERNSENENFTVKKDNKVWRPW